MAYKPSEQPVTKGMFQTSHGRTPMLMDRQLNQRDPVPMVGKGMAVGSTAKARANRNVRVTMKRDSFDGDMC